MSIDPDVVLQELEEQDKKAKRERDDRYKNRDEPTGKLCACGEEIIREIRFVSPRFDPLRDVIGPGGRKKKRRTQTLVCSGCGLLYVNLGPKLKNKE